MASSKKVQKEQDQAIRHLMDYVDASSKWSEYFGDLEKQLLASSAVELDVSIYDILDELLSGPYESMVHAYMFEELVTAHWNNEESNAIDEYLKERGWREGQHGRQYLRALSESPFIKLWQVSDVHPGEWIEIHRYATQTRPIRVYEKAASQQIKPGDSIVARVLLPGKRRIFSGSILPLSIEQATRVQECIEAVKPEVEQTYQELLGDGEIDNIDPVEVRKEIKEERQEVLVFTAFGEFVMGALASSRMPQIRNTDDESIVMSAQRFEIQGARPQVTSILNEHFKAMEEDHWIWESDKDLILANVRLDEKYVHLETNSVERSVRGVERLQSVLGDLIGTPMGVHESLESVMSARQPVARKEADEELQNNPQVQEQIQKHFHTHYRRCLDEPIEMLGNLSPRECAGDPAQQPKVINWLRDLERHHKLPGQEFNTDWLWKELKLQRPLL